MQTLFEFTTFKAIYRILNNLEARRKITFYKGFEWPNTHQCTSPIFQIGWWNKKRVFFFRYPFTPNSPSYLPLLLTLPNSWKFGWNQQSMHIVHLYVNHMSHATKCNFYATKWLDFALCHVSKLVTNVIMTCNIFIKYWLILN